MIGAMLAIVAFPAAAQQMQLKSLPSGGLMLKDMPGTDSALQELPGVRLNPQSQTGLAGSNCTQRRVSSFDLPGGYRPGLDGGTVSECSFGNFSVSTTRHDNAPARNVFGWQDGVPNPFGNGPPPGSGGFAPQN